MCQFEVGILLVKRFFSFGVSGLFNLVIHILVRKLVVSDLLFGHLSSTTKLEDPYTTQRLFVNLFTHLNSRFIPHIPPLIRLFLLVFMLVVALFHSLLNEIYLLFFYTASCFLHIFGYYFLVVDFLDVETVGKLR